MSVASKNPFDLLNDEAESKPVTAPAPSGTTTSGTNTSKPANRGRGPASRGGQYYPRGRGKAAPAPETTEVVDGKENTGGHFNRTEGREGRGRGRGRGRGGRGGRPFDRHSQTAIVDSEKQINQGWGADTGTAELAAESSALADAEAESGAVADWGAPAEDGAAAAVADWGAPADSGEVKESDAPKWAPPEEEIDNTLTLDEYLAQRTDSLSVLVGTKSAREANEGASGDLFKDAQKLMKGEEEETYFTGKAKAAPKPRAKKEEKITIEIDGQFADSGDRGGRGSRGRGGRGRGDRGDGGGYGGDRGDRKAYGGDRGDRSYGGDRGDRGGGRYRGGGGGGRGRNNTNTVDVADESAFPTLS